MTLQNDTGCHFWNFMAMCKLTYIVDKLIMLCNYYSLVHVPMPCVLYIMLVSLLFNLLEVLCIKMGLTENVRGSMVIAIVDAEI